MLALSNYSFTFFIFSPFFLSSLLFLLLELKNQLCVFFSTDKSRMFEVDLINESDSRSSRTPEIASFSICSQSKHNLMLSFSFIVNDRGFFFIGTQEVQKFEDRIIVFFSFSLKAKLKVPQNLARHTHKAHGNVNK